MEKTVALSLHSLTVSLLGKKASPYFLPIGTHGAVSGSAGGTPSLMEVEGKRWASSGKLPDRLSFLAHPRSLYFQCFQSSSGGFDCLRA
jgi:hypothetical protein